MRVDGFVVIAPNRNDHRKKNLLVLVDKEKGEESESRSKVPASSKPDSEKATMDRKKHHSQALRESLLTRLKKVDAFQLEKFTDHIDKLEKVENPDKKLIKEYRDKGYSFFRKVPEAENKRKDLQTSFDEYLGAYVDWKESNANFESESSEPPMFASNKLPDGWYAKVGMVPPASEGGEEAAEESNPNIAGGSLEDEDSDATLSDEEDEKEDEETKDSNLPLPGCGLGEDSDVQVSSSSSGSDSEEPVKKKSRVRELEKEKKRKKDSSEGSAKKKQKVPQRAHFLVLYMAGGM